MFDIISQKPRSLDEILDHIEKRHEKVVDIITKLEMKDREINRKNVNKQLRKRRIYVSHATVGRHIRLYKHEKEQAKWEMPNM